MGIFFDLRLLSLSAIQFITYCMAHSIFNITKLIFLQAQQLNFSPHLAFIHQLAYPAKLKVWSTNLYIYQKVPHSFYYFFYFIFFFIYKFYKETLNCSSKALESNDDFTCNVMTSGISRGLVDKTASLLFSEVC